jgi:hypothetical protein
MVMRDGHRDQYATLSLGSANHDRRASREIAENFTGAPGLLKRAVHPDDCSDHLTRLIAGKEGYQATETLGQVRHGLQPACHAPARNKRNSNGPPKGGLLH